MKSHERSPGIDDQARRVCGLRLVIGRSVNNQFSPINIRGFSIYNRGTSVTEN